MAKTTHIALFANAADQIAIQASGVSAEAAIAAAVKATGAPASDFVTYGVTARMGALLDANTVPESWVTIEADGMIDCEVVYAVFADTTSALNDADDTVTAYRNLHGQDITADCAYDAAMEAVEDCGVPIEGEYTVVSYPRVLAFDDVFHDAGDILHTLRSDVNEDLIRVETPDCSEDDKD